MLSLHSATAALGGEKGGDGRQKTLLANTPPGPRWSKRDMKLKFYDHIIAVER